MISLPIELEYLIISFDLSNTAFLKVNKEWNKETTLLRAKSATIISRWYRNHKTPRDINTVKDCIRAMVICEFEDYYITFPERALYVLGFNPVVIEVLPPIYERKRSHVRDWMMNLPVSLLEWMRVLIV
jgi:hypothetical protein